MMCATPPVNLLLVSANRSTSKVVTFVRMNVLFTTDGLLALSLSDTVVSVATQFAIMADVVPPRSQRLGRDNSVSMTGGANDGLMVMPTTCGTEFRISELSAATAT